MSLTKNFLIFLTIYLIITPQYRKKTSQRESCSFYDYKGLSKARMNKSKAKNKYINWLISYKRTKNKCNSLTKKAKRNFFNKVTKDGIITSKKILRTAKTFLINNW